MVKVYLLVGKLPFYKDLINYPPVGIRYLNRAEYSTDIVSYYSSLAHSLKRNISSLFLERLKIPRMIYVFNKECDIIHSNRGILVLNKKPWVIDLDYVGYFFGNNLYNPEIKNSYLRFVVEKFLKSNNCQKIIAWSNAGKLSITNLFNSKSIGEKTETLYPAMPTLARGGIKKHDMIRLLYVSSSFAKGGGELLPAFNKLMEKYDNLELFFKCDVPDEFKSRYSFENIKYLPYKSQLLPRDELIRQFHMNSDILVYPTLGDLFGLGILDAMVAGIPVVTTDTFAIPEIVEDGKGGFLIKPYKVWYDKRHLPLGRSKLVRKKEDFIKDLVAKLSLLIENAALRRKMGGYNRKLVESGKFSMKERNNKLKQIYENAV